MKKVRQRTLSLVLALAMALLPASAWAAESENESGFQIREDGYLSHYTGEDTSVVIPDGVKVIGKNAFSKCATLEELVIPDSVEEIQYAFNGCVNLRRVTVGSGVTTVAGMLFVHSKELEEVICSPELDPSVAVKLQGFQMEGTKITGRTNCEPSRVTIPEGVTEVDLGGARRFVSISLPDSVTTISDNCFVGGDVLEQVELGSGLKTIGKSAFKECPELTSLALPDGLESIGEGAFEGCAGLTSVVIPDSVTSIGDGAFKDCKNLTSVVLPSGSVQMGKQVFQGCDQLDDVSGEAALDWTDAAAQAGFEIKLINGNEAVLMAYHGPGGDVVIPDGVTGIAGKAFRGNTSITSVVMPDSVTDMAYMVGSDYYGTFMGCANLRSVKLSENLTRIPDSAFRDCTSLEELVIPDSVTQLGSGFVIGCTALESYTQGGEVKKLGQNENENENENKETDPETVEKKRQAAIDRLKNNPAYQERLKNNKNALANIDKCDYQYTAVTDEVQAKSDEICRGLTTDTEKVTAIHKWVTENIYYDYPILAGIGERVTELEGNTQTAQNVLNNKRGVCEGYSRLFQSLCWAQEIPCVYASGMAIPGGFHGWNAVLLDGEWLWVDATWDTFNKYYGESSWVAGDQRLDYFLCSSEFLATDHGAKEIKVDSTDELVRIAQYIDLITGEVRSGDRKASDWAKEELIAAMEAQMFPYGYSRPDYTRDITRHEFCMVAVQMIEQYTGQKIEDYGTSKGVVYQDPFTDWHDEDVSWIYALGIIKGTGDGTTFSPRKSITRQEAAVILARVARVLGISGGEALVFADEDTFGPWAADDISYLSGFADPTTGKRVMQGTGGGNFSPEGSYTWEQSLITFLRLYHCGK